MGKVVYTMLFWVLVPGVVVVCVGVDSALYVLKCVGL
jgi:hypothetical protein